MRRGASILLIAVWLGIPCAVAQQNQTLAEVLKQESISFAHAEVPHLDSPITSYATLNDNREFLIAYYLAGPDSELRFPLFLSRLDKRSKQWQHRSHTGLKARAFEGTDEKPQNDCLGSVVAIHRNGQRYYLDLHWTPSAGCLLILKHDLTVDKMLGGWTAAFFRSGLLVYSGNMVHFADVHPETLFLYDPKAHRSLQLYPEKNDPARRDFSARLAMVIDKRQCSENNWACSPDRFTSTIDTIEVNDQTGSLAFRATFDPEGFTSRQNAEDSGRFDDDQYVYIYTLAPLRWREFSVYDLKPMFGTDSLKELLTPAQLHQVFATPGLIPLTSRHSRLARAR